MRDLMNLSQFVTAAILVVSAASSQAALVSLSNITAAWSNVSPTGVATIDNSILTNPTARWGGDTGFGLSGYNFGAVAGQIDNNVPPNSAPFKIGDFTHLNQPISPPSITGIDLTVSALVSVDMIDVGVLNFVFRFSHDETPNAAPCPYGPSGLTGVNVNGCADRVTFASLGSSNVFNVGGTFYTISAAGFNVDGISTSDFLTVERANNNAELLATISVSNEVPEPGTLALVSLCLLGLGVARRRSN